MKARVLLLPPAFLIAGALLRPAVEVVSPPRAPKLEVTEPAPERPSLLAAIMGLLPRPSAPKPEPRLIGEIVRVGSQKFAATTRTQVIARVAELLELAYLCFRKERYVQCVDVCDRILLIVPSYDPALEIRNVARRLCHARVSDLSSVLTWIEELAQQTNDDADHPRIPEMNLVEVQDAAAAAILLEVVGPAFEKEHPVKTAPDLQEIHRKLGEDRYDLAFESGTWEDILACIRDYSRLNILLDAECRDHVGLEHRTKFHVQDMLLRDVLRILLAPYGLEYVVTEEGVVVLTAPHRVASFMAKN